MDFLPAAPREVPRQLYKTELTLSVGSPSRRGSASSDGNKGRRKSFSAGLGASGNGKQPESQTEGVWYWSCLVGVDNQNLVVLPQSKTSGLMTRSPKGSAWKKQPAPARNSGDFSGTAAAQDPSAGGKGFMSSVRRLSTSFGSTPAKPAPPAQHDQAQDEHHRASTDATTAAGAAEDRETGWPGVVDGNALQAIVVPLSSIGKVAMDASSKSGSTIDVGVRSAVNGKAGTLSFNFSNDWIGGKGTAEVLFNKIEGGVEKTRPMFGTDMFKGGTSRTRGADKEYNDSWRADVRGRW